ncbi:MAG TPA: hypothetical protein VMF14_14535 [Solirubrobacteraceae bacterium]|nr:hypothetical protein [Solirubrobacteraceae bacterium]
MKRPGGAAAALVGCLAVTACGGHTATKQDVVARANGICINTLRAARSVPPPAGGAGSPAALAAYLQKVVPIVEKEASDTRALPRPAQDRAVLDRYVAAVSADASQYRALARAAKNDDLAAISHGLAALRASQVPALAARYGLTRCSASAGSGVS